MTWKQRFNNIVFKCQVGWVISRLESTSYMMYALGFPKESRIRIMAEAEKFEKWSKEVSADICGVSDK